MFNIMDGDEDDGIITYIIPYNIDYVNIEIEIEDGTYLKSFDGTIFMLFISLEAVIIASLIYGILYVLFL